METGEAWNNLYTVGADYDGKLRLSAIFNGLQNAECLVLHLVHMEQKTVL
jgi:hypothetical protein